MRNFEKHFTLRINAELLQRFQYVAKYDCRSMNGMLLSMIRKCIAEFEEIHGRISQFADDSE